MIPMSPMFEAMPGFLKTAKHFYFGKGPQKPSIPGGGGEGGTGDVRSRIMTAAKKSTRSEEGGVGGVMRKVMNRNKLLAAAAE